jgi:hypothetical protein
LGFEQLAYCKQNQLSDPGLKPVKEFLEMVGMMTIYNIKGVRAAIHNALKGEDTIDWTNFDSSKFGLAPQQVTAQYFTQYPPSASATGTLPPESQPTTSNPIDPNVAAQAAGIKFMNTAELTVFNKIMQKAEKAETTVQLNISVP